MKKIMVKAILIVAAQPLLVHAQEDQEDVAQKIRHTSGTDWMAFRTLMGK